MQTKAAWAVTGLGGLLVLLGAAVMVVLGPDGRLVTGPHAIDTSGVAVVTKPGVLSWKDVRVDLLAEVPAGKPVFIGVGNSVDVNDYLAATRRLEVTSFRTPWTLRTRQVDGEANVPSAPTALDWWIADAAGLGGAKISLTLPDETVSVAVVSVGAANLGGLKVTAAYGVQGGFGRGLGLALFGAGLAWGGLLWRRSVRHHELVALADGIDDDLVLGERSVPEEALVIEEEIFIYVDEDGVEHEISAGELDGYEIVDDDEPRLSDGDGRDGGRP